MPTSPARTLSISIACPASTVAAYLAKPTNFAHWASGLAGALEADPTDPGWWLAHGPSGAVRIRFSAANPFGVADHWVELPDGSTVYVPLRTVTNGDGAEVMLTLFLTPETPDARFEADCAWVRRDLAALKARLETVG